MSELRVQLPATMLHDLRTPLNQIIGYGEMLEEQAGSDGFGGMLPDIQQILASGRQLLSAINSSFISVAGEENVGSIAPRQYEYGADVSTIITEEFVGPDIDPERSPQTSAGMILVVDDGSENRAFLSKRLIRWGHEVVAVAGGVDALSTVRSRSFDLILLDIMMPEMDGFEVLSQLKSDPKLSPIPVVMISALSEVDSIARCILLGADDYLVKPFEQTLLKARIDACLEKKQAHDREKQLVEQLQENIHRQKVLEKQRDDLTDMIVRDVRTHVMSIIVSLNSLGLVGNLNRDQKQMMAVSSSRGDLLLGMINDLMAVEKLTSSTMQLRSDAISVSDLIVSAVSQVSSLAEDKQLSVVCDIDESMPELIADEGKLSRTLFNLLGNAIKFSPPGGQITVTAMALGDGEFIEISVADRGEGIPPEALGTIFEKFTQLGSRAGGRSMSTGLGLAFCKLVVDAHGGYINVRSEIGSGSTFTITLPCRSVGSHT